MAVDPYWLLSTTAQSSAALVAIVGGFLISRVIALSGDRGGVQRRAAELGRQVEALDEELSTVSAEVLRRDAVISSTRQPRSSSRAAETSPSMS